MHIDKGEVLRYLGFKGKSDSKTEGLIEECTLEIKELNGTGKIYRIFDIEVYDERVKIINSAIELEGKDIVDHLRYSHKCAIMAATLGTGADNRIRFYKKTDLAKAIVFDACASAAIESICDNLEDEIRFFAKEKYKAGITNRYSPGYGDFPLISQDNIINVLNASTKIGLTVTENSILIPTKSVTAIIGITNKNDKRKHTNCDNCNLSENCTFRKGGNYCGNQ